MTRRWDRDPVQEAYDLWIAHGWTDSADGMTAVTSILRLHRVLTQGADAVLAPLELTFARYEVLVLLYFNADLHQDGVPLSFLSKALGLHPASVTSLVDKLERQGCLERRPHASDRRVTLALITRTGRARTRTAIRRLNTELYSRLGLSPDETQTLLAIFAKMRRAWGDVKDGGADAGGADLPVAQSSA